MTRLWRERMSGKIAIYDEMLADLMAQMNDAANKANYVLLEQLQALYQDILGEKNDYVSDTKDDWRQMYITDEEKYLDRVKNSKKPLVKPFQ